MGDPLMLHASPSPENLVRLRAVCHLRPPPPQKVAAAITASLHCVIARSSSGEVVGIVRAIGDGHIYVQIVGMVVHLDHQRKGTGRRMLKGMTAWVDDECGDVCTSLIALSGSEEMCREEGFVETGGRDEADGLAKASPAERMTCHPGVLCSEGESICRRFVLEPSHSPQYPSMSRASGAGGSAVHLAGPHPFSNRQCCHVT